jgi:3-oxoacyl-[acyl-carrier protein] reductase
VAAEAERMVLEAVARLGRLDLLVNNAGTPGGRAAVPPEDFAAMTEEFWQTILQTNLLGVFRCSKAAVPALRAARGAIVSVASIAGVSTQGSSSPYGASKAGVVNLTRSLARGLGPEVRVNAVAPGSVDNDAWPIEWSEAYRREAAEQAVLKRRCAPEDIAEVIVFLGFGAAMVTGQTLVVDGGLTL